jgi:hypothetical protein
VAVERVGDPQVWGTLAVGVLAWVFVVVETTVAPADGAAGQCSRPGSSTATNLVTFVVYGALGGVLFLLVVALQVVAGSPRSSPARPCCHHGPDAAAVRADGGAG